MHMSKCAWALWDRIDVYSCCHAVIELYLTAASTREAWMNMCEVHRSK